MNATQGVLLIMMGGLILYLAWNPAFKLMSGAPTASPSNDVQSPDAKDRNSQTDTTITQTFSLDPSTGGLTRLS